MTNFSSGWGGGERWFLSVGNKLLERGFEVQWWVKTGSVLEQKLKSSNRSYFTGNGQASNLLNPFAVHDAIKAVKSFAPDIVLLNASHELKLGGMVCKWAGVPAIIFRRGVSYPLSKNALNSWYMNNVATAFLANSNSTFNSFAAAFPIVKKIPNATIYNGIELSEHEHYDKITVPSRILMSARLSPEKGIDRALKVIAKIKEKGIDCHLRVLGEGPQLQHLENYAKALGIEDRVTFVGFVEDVEAELAQAAVFLFTPVRGEGTSFALVEAMAIGLPCLAFNSPSMDEVIIENETGYLINNDNVEGMANKLIDVLNDPELQQRLGENGRNRAFSHFSLDRLVNQLTEFFLIV